MAWPGSSSTRSMPGPITWSYFSWALSSAAWPALTELIASCLPVPPNA